MNFKKTAVALAMGMMMSGGVMAEGEPEAEAGIVIDFTSLAAALSGTSANIAAIAASINEVALDGSITIEGATVSFSAIDSVTANATASAENSTASARAINGNSLATTVIGAMGTMDFENRVSDAVATDFAAQSIDSTLASLAYVGAESTDIVSGLGNVAMISASVNQGELAGHISIKAVNDTPTWFLSEQTIAAVNLTNLDAATTVIGAMNTTNAINEVMRDVSLKTAVQVIGTPTAP